MSEHTTINLIHLGDVPEGGQDDELEAAVLALVGAAFETAADTPALFGALVSLGSLRNTLNLGAPHIPPLPKAAGVVDRLVDLLSIAERRVNGEPDD